MKVYIVLAFVLVGLAAAVEDRVVCDQTVDDAVYNYDTTLLSGTTYSFKDLEGKVALFVPSANYDARAYENQLAVQALAKKFGDVMFFMFSTAQFNFGEVFTNEGEFMNVLKYVRPGDGFVPPSNMLYAKTADINGALGTKIFVQYLTEACGYTRPEFREDITNHVDATDCTKTNPSENMVNDVRNPFEAFLIGKNGKVVYRYDVASFSGVADDIAAQL